MRKKLIILLGLIFCLRGIRAQDPITAVINEGISKVIRAVDLKIQRLQNETIWLQQAQKQAENLMSKLKLQEIADWVEKQRLLYQDYFLELYQVKNVVGSYEKVKEIIALEKAIVRDYKKAWQAVQTDLHFTLAETEYMGKVYSSFIDRSVKTVEGVSLVIQPFFTEMTDVNRIEVIDNAVANLQALYNNLRRFSNQNLQLSIARAKDESEIREVKNLYGIQ